MKVLYGTTNQAKVDLMNLSVNGLEMEIISLKDLNQPIPNVEEVGKSPLENAILKAKTYYDVFKMPVFSCDSGLFFDNFDVDDSIQPGTYVRRVNGCQLTDLEMIKYYSNLSKKFGNQLVARYKNGISFIYDKEHIYNSMDDTLSGEEFMLTDKPYDKWVEGFPLDAISIDCETKQYYYDLENNNSEHFDMQIGFNKFFGKALAEIIKIGK